MDIFDSLLLNDLLEFKWETYSKNMHLVGAAFHLFYLVVFMLYIITVYIDHNLGENGNLGVYVLYLAIGIAYPTTYDLT